MIKRCPKCHGNVYLDEDQHGWFEHCLQCGYTADLQGMLNVREREALMKGKKATEGASDERATADADL